MYVCMYVLLVVRLSLRCDFPQAFGIACVLQSYSFALILSDQAGKTTNTLVLPHGSGTISEACVFAVCIT